MSKTWTCGILFLSLGLAGACMGEGAEPGWDEELVSADPSESPEASAISEVSPELFDLLLLWTSDATAGVGVDGGMSKQMNLEHYVRLHDPTLAAEVAGLLKHAGGAVMKSGCGCQVLATVDASPVNRQSEYDHKRNMRKWPNQNSREEEHLWTAEAHGAAHRGEFYRFKHHGLTSHEKDRQNHTQMRFQLLCRDGQGNYCVGSCDAKMYVYAEYGTRLYGWADTGGIWDKAAHAAVADGATLTYGAPYQTPIKLFEKAGSVSHHGNKTAFNIDEAITFVKGALQIYAAVTSSSGAGIDPDLVGKMIKALARLIHRSGNNGSTEREMYAAYDSTQEGFFDVSYSSSSAQVHTVRLTSQARLKNRGWGGHNEDRTRYASAYLLAVAMDHFQCGGGVLAPQRGGVWRYASTPSAPYAVSSLQSMTQGFFNAMGIPVNAQHAGGNSWQ